VTGTRTETGLGGTSRRAPFHIRHAVLLGAIVCALATLSCNEKTVTAPKLTGGRSVLFIGNSLTYENDLPGTLTAIGLSVGDTIRTESVAGPNLALIDHYEGHTEAKAVIARGGWDYVVLQQGPSSLALNRDTLVHGAVMLNPLIRAVGAKPALYMVWPEYERINFFDAVRDSYLAAADTIDGEFFPAGEAWRAAWAVDPTIQLYSLDEFHPSALGTYLVALVMYERITGHDARNLPTTNIVVGGFTLATPASTIRVLQNAAHETNSRY
jgi:hypothetical protein